LEKEIIILGSSGFIGNNLFNALKKEKKKVTGYNSRSLNLLKLNIVKKAFSKIKKKTTLIICSAVLSQNFNNKNQYKKNILIINNIVKSIDKKKVNKIIFLSSVDVYSKSKNIRINEKTIPEPKTLYGKSKILSEKILFNFCSNIPLLVLRLPGVYGYGDKFNSTIGKFITQAFNNRKIYVSKGGEERRDYLYIEDLIFLIKKLINRDITGILNIVTGKSVKIIKVVKEIGSILEAEFELIPLTKKNKVENLIFDNKLFTSIFPDFKFINFTTAVKKYINILRKL